MWKSQITANSFWMKQKEHFESSIYFICSLAQNWWYLCRTQLCPLALACCYKTRTQTSVPFHRTNIYAVHVMLFVFSSFFGGAKLQNRHASFSLIGHALHFATPLSCLSVLSSAAPAAKLSVAKRHIGTNIPLKIISLKWWIFYKLYET